MCTSGVGIGIERGEGGQKGLTGTFRKSGGSQLGGDDARNNTLTRARLKPSVCITYDDASRRQRSVADDQINTTVTADG